MSCFWHYKFQCCASVWRWYRNVFHIQMFRLGYYNQNCAHFVHSAQNREWKNNFNKFWNVVLNYGLVVLGCFRLNPTTWGVDFKWNSPFGASMQDSYSPVRNSTYRVCRFLKIPLKVDAWCANVPFENHTPTIGQRFQNLSSLVMLGFQMEKCMRSGA